LWSFASLGILSLHVPCSSMAWKSVALPYDCKMRYRITGHLTTYDVFWHFYRFSDRMLPFDIVGRRMGLRRRQVHARARRRDVNDRGGDPAIAVMRPEARARGEQHSTRAAGATRLGQRGARHSSWAPSHCATTA
jgi:hypothetical protein